MKQRRAAFAAAFFFMAGLRLFAIGVPSVFNKNISENDLESLQNGNVVIRKLDSVNEFCLSTENAAATKALQTAKALKPNYIAEIIKVYPYKGNENLVSKFDSLIMDIPSYVGIPYYSERTGEWYELYSDAKIVSSGRSGNREHVLADLKMSPFGIINTQIDTELGVDSFYYESTNLNRLRYKDKFNCVNPKKMKSSIAIFRSGDSWILYGIGAVDAPSIFFLRDRVETSFMNRIKTFCSYFFAKI